ncbi:hypothetical protein OS493_037887 [Desmophyllum pertusum]|uniref:EF-hand domain-containing protein n=1 Tax=Desmophyllum pertusum TaxID=174260 RepID=A0A9X0CDJ5_9CNID|nr:hypothetical protein OS493_037887 [Desmophyllum pertusum]
MKNAFSCRMELIQEPFCHQARSTDVRSISTSTSTNVLTRFDKNGDGFISESEVLASVWKILALYDLNSDQKISRDEFDILLKVTVDVKEITYLNHFRAADTNHDGYVTDQELKERFTQISGMPTDMNSALNVLRKNDQNGDGKLNYKEYKTVEAASVAIQGPRV